MNQRIGTKGAKEVKEQSIYNVINFTRLEAGRIEAPFVPDVSVKPYTLSHLENDRDVRAYSG